MKTMPGMLTNLLLAQTRRETLEEVEALVEACIDEWGDDILDKIKKLSRERT